VRTGTNTSKSVTPFSVADNRVGQNHLYVFSALAVVTGTSGTGAANTNADYFRRSVAPTTAIGYAIYYYFPGCFTNGDSATSAPFDWSKRIITSFKMCKGSASTDSNTVGRIILGRAATSVTAGDLAVRGIGVTVAGSGALVLQVHDGTTLTNVTSSFTPSQNVNFKVKMISDGAGNVTLYVNDSQVATTALGPKTKGAVYLGGWDLETQNLAVISTPAMAILVANPIIELGQ
jgi:hypothetical protein